MSPDPTPTPPVETDRRYRRDVDGLRAVAILSVLAFHAAPQLVPGGYVGVDVFFVISGFLISGIVFRDLDRGAFRFADFWTHRVRRIFPALAAVLLATWAFGWLALLPEDFERLGRHMAAGAGFVENLNLRAEAGYFDVASETKPLMHLWSLAIEEQFYLLYPLSVWAVWRVGMRPASVVGFVLIVSFAWNLLRIGPDPVGTFFAVETRLWELLIGGLAAAVALEARRGGAGWARAIERAFAPGTRLADVLSLAGAAAILVATASFDRATTFPGVAAALPVLGAVALLVAGPGALINRSLLAARPMVFVGLISYPLYLWHWPLLAAVRILGDGGETGVAVVAAVVASVGLATATWRWVERPLRYGPCPRPKVLGLVVAVAALGLLGLFTWQRQGFDFRMRSSTVDLAQLKWPDAMKREAACVAAVGIDPRDAANSFCRGDLARADVIVVGDSHSNALWPGLDERLPGRVVNVAGGNCVPARGFEPSASEGRVDCPARAAAHFLDLAATAPGLSTVIVTMGARADVVERAAEFEPAFRETLTRFAAAGRRVIVVLDVPAHDFRPKSCVAGPVLAPGRLRTPCATPRERHTAATAPFMTLLRRATSGIDGVELYDPTALFCDESLCWALRDGRLLYRDPAHLSVDGSRRVAGDLAERIADRAR